jgi:CDP-4-dehydro-6-deoxyglucose reductase, E3
LLCPVRARSGAPVQRLVIEMPDAFAFRAGQYLEVVHPEGPIPLSIASGPRRLPELHLHYRSTPGVREAAWMDELLAAGNPLNIRGPSGNVCLPDDPATPLLLIAGGTGISQVCAMLDELSIVRSRAPVHVLWCADSDDDLYCRMDLEQLRAPWLRIECVADARRDAENAGLRRIAGLGAMTSGHAEADRPAPWTLLAGSPGFVHAACDALAATGVEQARLHSDVFAWAPRPERTA